MFFGYHIENVRMPFSQFQASLTKLSPTLQLVVQFRCNV